MAHINRALSYVLLVVLAAVFCAGGYLYYSHHPQLAGAYDIDTSVPLVQAAQADSLVDSMGVGMHFEWTPRPSEEIYADFADLGIRYMRDDLVEPYDQYLTYGSHWIERIQHLKQQGVSTLAIANISVSATDVLRYLHAANDSQPGTINAVEGPDEVDFGCYPDGNFTGHIWVQCTPTDRWLTPTSAYLTALRTAMKGDAATTSLPLYSPAINDINYGVDAPVIRSTSDFGSIHYYPMDMTPWRTTSIANEMAGANQFYGNLPSVITEIGFPSVTRNQDQQTDETLQAKVTPLYYLQAFKDGVKRTYLYDLVKADAGDSTTGLIDQDGRKKPAYYAVKNLISLLKDPGPSFNPGQVRYQLTGADANKVTSQLFQKRDGSYYLAIWQPGDTASPAPTSNTVSSRVRTVGVKFGTALDSAKVIKSTDGTDPYETIAAPVNLNNIQLDDGPQIIQLTLSPDRGPSGGPSGTPTATPTHRPSFSPPATFKPHPSSHTPSPNATPEPTPTANAATPEPSEVPAQNNNGWLGATRWNHLFILLNRVLTGRY